MKFPNPFKRAETVSRDQLDTVIALSLAREKRLTAERDAALDKIARMQGGLSKGTAASAAKRRKG